MAIYGEIHAIIIYDNNAIICSIFITGMGKKHKRAVKTLGI